MKKLALTLFIAFFYTCSFSQNTATINWITFEQLGDSLKNNPKKVIIYLYTDWCVYCKKMDKEVFSNQNVINKINSDLYAVKLDAEIKEDIHFDGVLYQNSIKNNNKRSFHDLALLLGGKNNLITPPVTLFFDKDFNLKNRTYEYLSIKKILYQLNQY